MRIEGVPFIAGRADWRGRKRATRRGHGRRARARGRRRGRRQGGTGRAPPPCASDRDWPDSAIMSGDGSPVTYVQTKTTVRLVLDLASPLPLPLPRASERWPEAALHCVVLCPPHFCASISTSIANGGDHASPASRVYRSRSQLAHLSEPYTTPGSPVKLQRTLARSCIAKFIYCSRPLQELRLPDRSGDSATYSTPPSFPLHFLPSAPNCACPSRTACSPRRAMRHFILLVNTGSALDLVTSGESRAPNRTSRARATPGR